MIDIRINVHCPDLVTAAGLLAGARTAPVPPQEAPKPSPTPTPAPAPQTPPAPHVTHPLTTGDQLPENVVQITTTHPVAELPTSMTQAHTPAQAPTTGPSYTAADIARAGAMLIQANPGIQPQLQALLGQFGVQAAMDLKPEQLGNFANALRGMGAKL